MKKLILKTLKKMFTEPKKKPYPESKGWYKVKGVVWNFNDFMRLLIKGVLYLSLLATIFYCIYNIFSGSSEMFELFLYLIVLGFLK